MTDLDDVLARLDRRVADAAEAWLTDPRDTGIYTRLVAAVAERRAVLDAVPRAALHAVPAGTPDDAPDDPQRADAGPAATPHDATPDDAPPDADENPEDDAPDDPQETPDDEPAVPLRPVGADLLGDPRAVLDRLRRG